MNSYRVTVLLLLAVCLGCERRSDTEHSPGNAPAIGGDYFPLVTESKRTYEYSFQGDGGLQTIVTKHIVIDGTSVFFAIDEADLPEDSAIIGPELPGLGAYVRDAEGIGTIPCFWKQDLSGAQLSGKQAMLEFPLRTGDATRLVDNGGERQTTLTVTAFETVTVPAGTFENCARIEIAVKWQNGKRYAGIVWLAEGIGVVKWRKRTGRLEELASFQIPGVPGRR